MIAKLGASGTFSIENTKLISDLLGRAPLSTKQFVEDNRISSFEHKWRRQP